ncbi:hypothetical protein SDC9_179275 [bioreactor metagenome]|uniref:Uncharacterized protein n=1 Tax=bioreactor metagenome TaxID=1076179 RepID=A0A645GZG1_9ZZZZ
MSHHVLGPSGYLQAVSVDYRAQIVKLVVACRHGAFPYGAFCQLAVAHYRIDSVVPVIHLPRKRHSHADRKAMPQRAGVHLDSRKLVVGMSDKLGAEFAELGDHILDIKESLCCQDRIVRFHGMPFAHDELVAVRVICIQRAYIHLIKINLCQYLHDAHVSADMSGFPFHNHVDYIFS